MTSWIPFYVLFLISAIITLAMMAISIAKRWLAGPSSYDGKERMLMVFMAFACAVCAVMMFWLRYNW